MYDVLEYFEYNALCCCIQIFNPLMCIHLLKFKECIKKHFNGLPIKVNRLLCIDCEHEGA